MRTRAFLAQVAASIALATGLVNAGAAEEPVQYRGVYTWGHEVSTFCPDINSQCYWLSPDTPADVRDELRQLSQGVSSQPYGSVCVLIEAQVDRDSPRQGFAADYDGLITVSHLYGTCTDLSMVIASDLQHHRWVLETINGKTLPVPEGGKIPELDFGEGMTVTGNLGCNKFTGKAVLRDGLFLIEAYSGQSGSISKRRFMVLT